jgi:polysaccharide export outer membrane protein
MFGPRPPVMVTRSPTIVDYIDDQIEIDNTPSAIAAMEREEAITEGTPEGKQAKEKKRLDLQRLVGGVKFNKKGDRAPLLPEYFDPYQPLSEAYKISPGDMLEISIFGNADTVVNEAVVAPDGRLYYMFLEGVLAAGKTLKELKEEITIKVSDYFVDPEVSIIPRRVSGQNYIVLGKVPKPGVYPMIGSTTLQQAIGAAGGVALGGYDCTTINISSLRESYIVRDGKKLDVDFERLMYTDGFDQNIFMRPGDYIYIASTLFDDVYLLGEVRENKPIPYKDGLTLTAILAGVSGTTEGWTDQAHITRVLVVRGHLDCPIWYEVNVLKIILGEARDVYLLPGDIVYVQKKPFKFGRELVRLAIDSYITAFGSTAGIYYGGKVFKP